MQTDTVHHSTFRNINQNMVQSHTEDRRLNKAIGEDKTFIRHIEYRSMHGRRLGVASGATAPGPALEGVPRFRLMSLSSYILR